ncbi:hypothetical protein HDV00_000556, partial [Rhizophlyctis rosea]
LTYSKAENGTKHQMRIYEFDLFRLVEEVTESLGPVAARKNVKLYQFVEKVSPVVRKAIGPEGCLRQILVNIGNSIKFTEIGSVELIVSEDTSGKDTFEPTASEDGEAEGPDGIVRRNSRVRYTKGADHVEKTKVSPERRGSTTRPNTPDYLSKAEPHQQVDPEHPTRVVFTLNDTGCGMSPEFLEKIFSPFEQDMSDRLVRASEGTGLGLSIVKLLVDEMHGNIEVESHVGKGTTFRITIPLYHALDTSWLDPTITSLDGEFTHSTPSARSQFLSSLSTTKLGVWHNPHDAQFFTFLSSYLTRWGISPSTIDDIPPTTRILGEGWGGSGDEREGEKLKKEDERGAVRDGEMLREKEKMAELFDRLDVLFIDDDFIIV